MLAITTDLDWCPQEVFDCFVDIVKKYGYKVTVFCTHEVKIPKEWEVGIHPFFTDFNDVESALDDLLNIFPVSKGVRTHRCRISGEWFFLFREKGLQYDSSLFINRGITPYYYVKNMLEIPIYFADDHHLDLSKGFDDLKYFPNTSPYVFLFHPIHVFLNTPRMEYYWRVKPHLQDVNKLKKFQGKGIQTLFINFLEMLRKKDVTPITMLEICQKYQKFC